MGSLWWAAAMVDSFLSGGDVFVGKAWFFSHRFRGLATAIHPPASPHYPYPKPAAKAPSPCLT